MFVQGDGYIAIGTMRNLYAPVIIRCESDRPLTAGNVDRTAHGVLNVPSGVLRVSGATHNSLIGGTVQAPPGKYRVLVEYLNLGSMDDYGVEGDDHYVVTLAKSDK